MEDSPAELPYVTLSQEFTKEKTSVSPADNLYQTRDKH